MEPHKLQKEQYMNIESDNDEDSEEDPVKKIMGGWMKK